MDKYEEFYLLLLVSFIDEEAAKEVLYFPVSRQWGQSTKSLSVMMIHNQLGR